MKQRDRLLVALVGAAVVFLVCMLTSCSSIPGNSQGEGSAEKVASPPPVLATAVSASDLSGLTVENLVVDPLSSDAALTMKVSPTDVSSLRLRIMAQNNAADLGALTSEAQPDQNGNLVVQKIEGLQCNVEYRMEIVAKKAGVTVGSEYLFTIPEPISTDPFLSIEYRNETSSEPVLVSGNRALGSIPNQKMASAVEVRLRTAEGAVFATQKLPLDSQKIQEGQVSFEFIISATMESATLICDYRYQYNSGLVSSWHHGTSFSKAIATRLGQIAPLPNRPSMTFFPFFRWQELLGARYRLEIVRAATPLEAQSGTPTVVESTGSSVRVDLWSLFPGIRDGTVMQWRVTLFDKSMSSEWSSFSATRALDTTISVLSPGDRAEYKMGLDAGPPDTRPAHAVVLTKSIAVMRSPTTNAVFAELINRRIERKLALIRNTQVVSADTGQVIVDLAELGYGQQFGLFASQEGRIGLVPGRENHPAVGLTWFGAREACSEANWITGTQSGYWRLPTEAEWEYMASGAARGPSPWGAPVQGATANFMRSRDPFEDLYPPFTRKGGPTTPIGYFDSAREQQFRSGTKIPTSQAYAKALELSRIDVLGNVWEWCADWYYPYPTDTSTSTDPYGPDRLPDVYIKNIETLGQFPSRAVRGGAWNSEVKDIFPQARGKFPAEQTSFSVGFRMVKEIKP